MIGQKAICSIDYDAWIKKPVLKPLALKKAKNVKPIIHPIFVTCAKEILDEFWLEIFNRGAIGKFPPGFSFNNHNLVFKKDQKEFYGGHGASIKFYESCWCGNPHTNFRLSKPEDCPTGCTINPIIFEEKKGKK